MTTYSIIITLAFILVLLMNQKLIIKNEYQQRIIDRINKDHNDISKENIELRELLETQDKLLEAAYG
jgi:hypothetical protein